MICSEPVMVTVAVPLVAAALEPISFSHVSLNLRSYARFNVNALPYVAFAKTPNAVYGAVTEFAQGGLVVLEGTEKSLAGWITGGTGSTQLLVTLIKC